jgi:hypothetical protein
MVEQASIASFVCVRERCLGRKVAALGRSANWIGFPVQQSVGAL